MLVGGHEGGCGRYGHLAHDANENACQQYLKEAPQCVPPTASAVLWQYWGIARNHLSAACERV